GVRRQLRLLAALLCHFGDVLGVLEPGGVEGLRNDRHEKFDVAQFAAGARHRIAGKGVAGDLDDLVALDDAVRVAAIGLVSEPAHRFLSPSRLWSAIIAEPPLAATGCIDSQRASRRAPASPCRSSA